MYIFSSPKPIVSDCNFFFICNKNCWISEDGAKLLIFRIFLSSKLKTRLDLSHYFFNQFNAKNISLKTQVSLYKFKVIDNQIMISVNKNPKENFEYYKYKSMNKSHKKMKKRFSWGFSSLKKLRQYKPDLKKDQQFDCRKEKGIVELEQHTLISVEGLGLLAAILSQSFRCYKIDSNKGIHMIKIFV